MVLHFTEINLQGLSADAFILPTSPFSSKMHQSTFNILKSLQLVLNTLSIRERGVGINTSAKQEERELLNIVTGLVSGDNGLPFPHFTK